MRLGQNWKVVAWFLGDACRFAEGLQYNRGTGAQQGGKRRLACCTRTIVKWQHWQLWHAMEKELLDVESRRKEIKRQAMQGFCGTLRMTAEDVPFWLGLGVGLIPL